jgi:hypothetical protein
MVKQYVSANVKESTKICFVKDRGSKSYFVIVLPTEMIRGHMLSNTVYFKVSTLGSDAVTYLLFIFLPVGPVSFPKMPVVLSTENITEFLHPSVFHRNVCGVIW